MKSNVLVMDCDNDHSEDPEEWMTEEKLAELLPDVSYAIAYSRNHMKEKDGRGARPKFHVYFEIEETEDPDYYAALKAAVHEKYPFLTEMPWKRQGSFSARIPERASGMKGG